jgi:hypothetical protein
MKLRILDRYCLFCFFILSALYNYGQILNLHFRFALFFGYNLCKNSLTFHSVSRPVNIPLSLRSFGTICCMCKLNPFYFIYLFTCL